MNKLLDELIMLCFDVLQILLHCKSLLRQPQHSLTNALLECTLRISSLSLPYFSYEQYLYEKLNIQIAKLLKPGYSQFNIYD